MKKNSKAQVSMEYLMIVGLSFLVLIPTSYFFYQYSQTSNEAVVKSQINKIGNSFLMTAEGVYGLSEGSILTTEVTYPQNIKDMYILNKNELIIRYETSSGMSEAVFFSRVDLSGNYKYIFNTDCSITSRALCGASPCENSTITQSCPAQGNKKIKFESKGSYVFLYNTN